MSMENREALLSAVMDQDAILLGHLLAKITEETEKISVANQLLAQALDTSNQDIFEVLLASGAVINSLIESTEAGPFRLHNLRPIEFGIISGKIETVSVLLKMGVDFNFVNQEGLTPLHLACATVYFPVEGVKKLIEAGADCSRCCPLTPLHIAAACGRPAVVKLLLDHGADLHLTNSVGDTCLALALSSERSSYTGTSSRFRQDKISCAQILLDAGANANHCNANGVTILHSVITTPFIDSDVLSLLLNYGANPNKGEERSGLTPLNSLASMPLKAATDLMSILLEHGAEINKADKRGNTPLHHAASNNNLKVLTFLIDNGAEICSLNDQNLSFMDKLTHESYLDLLPIVFGKSVYPSKVAVHRGTDFDYFLARCRHRLPATPLTLALSYGKTETAIRLREMGFLTGEDIKWLPYDREVWNTLPANVIDAYDSVTSSGPCPLTLMSFVKVSVMLGATSDRHEKVDQLRLPVFLQERLLFKCRAPVAM